MVVPLILTAAIAGGAGGGIANIALSPANSGASLLNSYWYGAGLILGERDMYTFHWEKIKKRLENGEDYLSVLESEMNPAITAISAYSLQIMQKTGELYKQAGVNFLVDLLQDLLNPFFSGERTDSETTTPPSEDLPPPEEQTNYNQEQILNLSDNQISHILDFRNLYTEQAVSLAESEKARRIRNNNWFFEPLDTTCPEGQIWDPVSETCIPIIPSSTIPLITEANAKLHGRGRAVRNVLPDGTFTTDYLLQTNPQRNGSYQTKATAKSAADAQNWLDQNFPQSTHNQYGFKTPAVQDISYKILITDITVKNFPGG